MQKIVIHNVRPRRYLPQDITRTVFSVMQMIGDMNVPFREMPVQRFNPLTNARFTGITPANKQSNYAA